MLELIRTNDPVLLSWLTALLTEAGIKAFVFDSHTSVLEGSIGALPRRLVVARADELRACRLLAETDIHLPDPAQARSAR